MNDEIEKITLLKLSRGDAIRAGKLKAKIERMAVISEELMGRQDKCGCGREYNRMGFARMKCKCQLDLEEKLSQKE